MCEVASTMSLGSAGFGGRGLSVCLFAELRLLCLPKLDALGPRCGCLLLLPLLFDVDVAVPHYEDFIISYCGIIVLVTVISSK